MYDLIIVSKSDKEKYQKLTQQTIDTCLATRQGHRVNVIVVETSGKLFPYKNVNHNILFTQEFNYNACLNLGLKKAKYNIHLLANNDLIFNKGWADIASIMVRHRIYSASFWGQWTQNQFEKDKVYEGYGISEEVSGWLIIAHKRLIKRMGGLPTKHKFWYSDNDYIERVKELKEKHCLFTHARIEHIESQTFFDLKEEQQHKFKMK